MTTKRKLKVFVGVCVIVYIFVEMGYNSSFKNAIEEPIPRKIPELILYEN